MLIPLLFLFGFPSCEPFKLISALTFEEGWYIHTIIFPHTRAFITDNRFLVILDVDLGVELVVDLGVDLGADLGVDPSVDPSVDFDILLFLEVILEADSGDGGHGGHGGDAGEDGSLHLRLFFF